MSREKSRLMEKGGLLMGIFFPDFHFLFVDKDEVRSCSFSSFESSSGPGSAAETETETNCDFKQEEQEHNTNKHHQVSEEKEVFT